VSTVDRVRRWLYRVAAHQEGATAAEYALILALVAVVLISSLSALGAALNEKIRAIIDRIANAW